MTTPLDAFGPGIIIVTRTDIANSTPVNIGYAQEFTPEFSGSIKELFGQNQLPLDAARGTIKVTGKIKAAVLSGLAWNNVFFGDTFSTGGIVWNVSENHAIPGTPYQFYGNVAGFDADLGVVYGATNLPFTKVTALTATGQYKVAAVVDPGTWAITAGGVTTGVGTFTVTNLPQYPVGTVLTITGASPGSLNGTYTVTASALGSFSGTTAATGTWTSGGTVGSALNLAQYTFYSGDTAVSGGATVTYSTTTNAGQQLAVNNQLLGYAPTFQLDYYTSRNNKPFVARYYACQASKLSFASKLEDFIMPEFDFSMFVNSAGQLGKLVFPEIS
jgi:hypothetical protein